MKKILLIFTLLVVAGCATMTPFTPWINQGDERTAGIGDVFFQHTEGQHMNDPIAGEIVSSDSLRYDLTILELTKEKIGLQYNEFIYSSGSGSMLYPATYVPSGWMVKQGFNKRFDYAVGDGIVRFKGYEFEVLSVENGQIKYRRVK